MSEDVKRLVAQTEKRLAIFMTALEDFIKAFKMERSQLLNLVEIQEKVDRKERRKAKREEKARLKKERQAKKKTQAKKKE